MCDIDGILNNLVEKTLELYNCRSGKNIQLSDITSYNFFDCLPKEDADSIVALFKEKKLWNSLSSLPGSSNGLKTLIKQGHQVYFATATDPTNFAWKTDWMKKNFPFINADNIIRIIDKGLLKADIIIDDCLDNLINNTAHKICLDYPWNRDEKKDFIHDIYRTYNWKEIVSAVNEIERKDAEWER
jgi:5'(3')-deoxyribonucleotidase